MGLVAAMGSHLHRKHDRPPGNEFVLVRLRPAGRFVRLDRAPWGWGRKMRSVQAIAVWL